MAESKGEKSSINCNIQVLEYLHVTFFLTVIKQIKERFLILLSGLEIVIRHILGLTLNLAKCPKWIRSSFLLEQYNFFV